MMVSTLEVVSKTIRYVIMGTQKPEGDREAPGKKL